MGGSQVCLKEVWRLLQAPEQALLSDAFVRATCPNNLHYASPALHLATQGSFQTIEFEMREN